MKLTTSKLKKEIWGTPCGEVGPNVNCLSHPLVIDFIDTFFGGIFEDVKIGDTDGDVIGNFLLSGTPIMKKMVITNSEFDKFTLSDKTRIEYFADLIEEDSSNFKDIESLIDEEKHPNLICCVFESLVGNYGGSLRFEWMYEDDNSVDMESE